MKVTSIDILSEAMKGEITTLRSVMDQLNEIAVTNLSLKAEGYGLCMKVSLLDSEGTEIITGLSSLQTITLFEATSGIMSAENNDDATQVQMRFMVAIMGGKQEVMIASLMSTLASKILADKRMNDILEAQENQLYGIKE